MLAGGTTTARINPSVSTKMCRLTPLIFFPRVVPPLAAGSGRLDGLAVNAAGAGFGLLTGRLPQSTAEGVMDLRPQPMTPPTMEIIANRPFGREVMRQGRPRAPRAQDVEDGVENLPKIGGPGRTRWHGRWQ